MGKFRRPRASRARFDRRDHDMRIVVKVGTSTLAHPTGRLNIQRMEKLCKVLSDLKSDELADALADYGASMEHHLEAPAMNKLPVSKIEPASSSNR